MSQSPFQSPSQSIGTANLLRLVLLGAIWGGSFLFMRVSVPAFGPVLLIFLRVAVGALFLWLVCRALALSRMDLTQWRHYLVIGLFNSALPFTLFAWGAQRASASLLSIMNSTAPIWGTLIGMLWLKAPATRQSLLGQLFGIVGVAVIVGGNLRAGDTEQLLPMLACLGATCCYGISGTYTRWAKLKLDPLDMAHGSLWAATLCLAPLALASPIRQTPDPLQWASLGGLGVLCTGAAFLLYFRLIRDCGAPRALTVTFLIPVFGVLWGALLLGETVTPTTLAGGALVLLGTALANGLVAWPGRRG